MKKIVFEKIYNLFLKYQIDIEIRYIDTSFLDFVSIM